MLALRLAAVFVALYALVYVGNAAALAATAGPSLQAIGPAVVTLTFAVAAASELWRGRLAGYVLGLMVGGVAAVFSLYHGLPLLFRPRGASELQLAYWAGSLVLSCGTVALLALPSARREIASTGPAVG